MNDSLIQLILQERMIAFVVTDQKLIIQELHGQPEILDVSLENGMGRSLLEIFPELLGNQPDLADILAGKSSSLKLVYVNREIQGKTHYLTMEDLPYRDETGRILGIVHVVQDETIKGELEQQVTQDRNELWLLKDKIERQNLELVAANKELARTTELKSQFVHVAAHELRTPMNSLIRYTKMLLGGQVGPLTDQQGEVLKIVQDSGIRLKSMIDELLNAVRLEAGQIDLVLQPVDLTSLVKTVVDEFTPQILPKDQNLHLEFSSELPPALCDENWTKQIVTNLLLNAGKFAPERGHISIRVNQAGQPGFLQLSVADSGDAIPEKDQADIFSRWERSKETTPLSTQGSGMGLYITRSLVELNGGSIWYESQPNQGSVFHVTFPIAP